LPCPDDDPSRSIRKRDETKKAPHAEQTKPKPPPGPSPDPTKPVRASLPSSAGDRQPLPPPLLIYSEVRTVPSRAGQYCGGSRIGVIFPPPTKEGEEAGDTGGRRLGAPWIGLFRH